MLELFRAEPKPLFDPLGFLHLALGRAHAAVVAIGTKLAVDLRPRATCAVCLVQRQEAYWAHVGDSRIYHLRGGTVVCAHARPQPRRAAAARGVDPRGRDSRAPDAQLRRMLPGRRAALLPEMTISRRQPLEEGDVLMVCTDGVWSNLKDSRDRGPAEAARQGNGSSRSALEKLVERAVAASAPHSDNATAASLVWHH